MSPGPYYSKLRNFIDIATVAPTESRRVVIPKSCSLFSSLLFSSLCETVFEPVLFCKQRFLVYGISSWSCNVRAVGIDSLSVGPTASCPTVPAEFRDLRLSRGFEYPSRATDVVRIVRKKKQKSQLRTQRNALI